MEKTIFSINIIFFFATVTSAQVAIIANKSVPANEISSTQVLDFYTGDVRVWEDGKPVIVFDLKPKGEVKTTFYDFLGKTTSRMKSIWMKNMLSGEGDPPEALPSESEMLRKVADTPGAIGFVSEKTASLEVKVLAIIQENKED